MDTGGEAFSKKKVEKLVIGKAAMSLHSKKPVDVAQAFD